MKKSLLWILAITLFWLGILFLSEFSGLDLLSGFSGLVLLFFFAYCALILVAQTFAALAAFRRVLRRPVGGEKLSDSLTLGEKPQTHLAEE